MHVFCFSQLRHHNHRFIFDTVGYDVPPPKTLTPNEQKESFSTLRNDLRNDPAKRQELYQKAKDALNKAQNDKSENVKKAVGKLQVLLIKAQEAESELKKGAINEAEVAKEAAYAQQVYLTLEGLLRPAKAEAKVEKGTTTKIQENSVNESVAGFSARLAPSIPSLSTLPAAYDFNKFKALFKNFNFNKPEGREAVYAFVKQAVDDVKPYYQADVRKVALILNEKLKTALSKEQDRGLTQQKLAMEATHLLQLSHDFLYGKFTGELDPSTAPQLGPDAIAAPIAKRDINLKMSEEDFQPAQPVPRNINLDLHEEDFQPAQSQSNLGASMAAMPEQAAKMVRNPDNTNGAGQVKNLSDFNKDVAGDSKPIVNEMRVAQLANKPSIHEAGPSGAPVNIRNLEALAVPIAVPVAAPAAVSAAPADIPMTAPTAASAVPVAPEAPKTMPTNVPTSTVVAAEVSIDQPANLRLLTMSENFDTFKVQFGNLNTKENRLSLYTSAEKTAEMSSKNPNMAIKTAADKLLQDVKEARLNETRPASERTDPPSSLARILLKNFHNLMTGKVEAIKTVQPNIGATATVLTESTVLGVRGPQQPKTNSELILGSTPQDRLKAGTAARTLSGVGETQTTAPASTDQRKPETVKIEEKKMSRIPTHIIDAFKQGVTLIDAKGGQATFKGPNDIEWKGKLRSDSDGTVYVFTDLEGTSWRVKKDLTDPRGFQIILDPQIGIPEYVKKEAQDYFDNPKGRPITTVSESIKKFIMTDKYGFKWEVIWSKSEQGDPLDKAYTGKKLTVKKAIDASIF